VERDFYSHEARFGYVDSYRASHIVFFQDRPAILAKLQMLRCSHPNTLGIAIWRMGGETTEFWVEIAEQTKLIWGYQEDTDLSHIPFQTLFSLYILCTVRYKEARLVLHIISLCILCPFCYSLSLCDPRSWQSDTQCH